MDSADDKKEIAVLADEIAAYLREHEQASDTLEGIVRWWVMRRRLQEGQRQVAEALDILCKKGVVISRKMPDGVELFSSALRQNSAKGSRAPSSDSKKES